MEATVRSQSHQQTWVPWGGREEQPHLEKAQGHHSLERAGGAQSSGETWRGRISGSFMDFRNHSGRTSGVTEQAAGFREGRSRPNDKGDGVAENEAWVRGGGRTFSERIK